MLDIFSRRKGSEISAEDRNYKIVRKLGSGAIGKAYLVEGWDNQLYVAKLINPAWGYKDRIPALNEAVRLRPLFPEIPDKTLVTCTSIQDVEKDDWLITSYAPGTTLDQAIERKDVVKKITGTIAVTRKTITALGALDGKLVHGDLKPQNIILSPNYQDTSLIDIDTLVLDDTFVPDETSGHLFDGFKRAPASADMAQLGFTAAELITNPFTATLCYRRSPDGFKDLFKIKYIAPKSIMEETAALVDFIVRAINRDRTTPITKTEALEMLPDMDAIAA
jgi:serine/threonine protein kinase